MAEKKKKSADNVEAEVEQDDFVFTADEETASAMLDAELSGLAKVWIVFVWRPKNNSPVLIKQIQVNGHNVINPEGILDRQSPFRHSLGRHSKGAPVKVSWLVRALNDMNGIQAFIRAENAPTWKKYPPKVPFNYLDQYKGDVTYHVPR